MVKPIETGTISRTVIASDDGTRSPMHPQERRRQLQLDRLGLIEGTNEERFDSIVKLAAEIMDVPMAAISILDRERQWFKCGHGIPISEAPRSESFCSYAILDSEPLVVTDTRSDERFSELPWVRANPIVRSYVGVPIAVADAPPIGTLCVLDTKQRSYTDNQLAAFVSLAHQLEGVLLMDRTLDELTEANASLEQFTSNVSHDLRSPSRNIRNLVEFIQEDCVDSLDTVATGYLDAIVDRTNQMDALIDDLMAYARAGLSDDSGALSTPDDIITEVVYGLSVPTTFTVNVDVDKGGMEIPLPRVPISLCLRNLIANAIKHHDGEAGRIDIDVTTTEDHMVFTVTDDGPGIAEEFHAQLFEPFRRFQPDPVKSGTGLGLAIVDRTVKSHGAEISIVSEVGAGSTFRLSWPILAV